MSIDEDVIKKYISEVPIELRDIVKALSGDKELAVFIALIKKGGLSFSSLKDEFKAHPQTLSRTLKVLSKYGLVERYSKSLSDIGVKERTYYTTTELGEDFLLSLYDTLMPKREIIKHWWEKISEESVLTKKEVKQYSGIYPNVMSNSSSGKGVKADV